MPFRVSFFFQQQSTLLGGWSENFWSNFSDLTALEPKVSALRDALNAVTGKQVWTPFARVSDVERFREVQLFEYRGAQPNAEGTDADYPSTALLLKLNGPDNYITRQWLRGLPDNVVTDSGRYNPTATYARKMNALFAMLTNAANGWSIQALNKTTPSKVITNITNVGVVTCPLHGYADQAKIRIKGVKGLVQANGLWRITYIDANSFSLNFWVTPVVVVPARGNPTAKLQSYIRVAISSAIIIRATSHKTGHPIGLLGGRRKRRAS